MMKIKFLQTAALWTVMAFTVCSKADLFHEGFESGDFSNWGVSIEATGPALYAVEPEPNQYVFTNYPFDPLTNPYIVQDVGFVDDVSAPDGNRYLQLTPGGGSTGNHFELRDFDAPNGDPYVFLDRNYRIVLSRDFSIAVGQSLSLWADFYTEDYPPYDFDDLEVRINGDTIFKLSVSDVYEPPIQPSYDSGWINVLWSPTAAGTYTLSLVGSQDDQAFSSASFDSISIVPEPAAWVIFAMGLAVLAWKQKGVTH